MQATHAYPKKAAFPYYKNESAHVKATHMLKWGNSTAIFIQTSTVLRCGNMSWRENRVSTGPNWLNKCLQGDTSMDVMVTFLR